MSFREILSRYFQVKYDFQIILSPYPFGQALLKPVSLRTSELPISFMSDFWVSFVPEGHAS